MAPYITPGNKFLYQPKSKQRGHDCFDQEQFKRRSRLARFASQAAEMILTNALAESGVEHALSHIRRRFGGEEREGGDDLLWTVEGRIVEQVLAWQPSIREKSFFLQQVEDHIDAWPQSRRVQRLREISAAQQYPLVTISGGAAVGKSSLARWFLLNHIGLFRLVPSYTSRSARRDQFPGEYAACDMDPMEFYGRKEEFLWIVQAHGHLYGTLKSDVVKALGNRCVFHVMILTIEGVRILREYADCSRILSVYLQSPGEQIVSGRLRRRGGKSTEEERDLRLRECGSWDEEAARSGLFHMLPTAGLTERQVREAFLDLLLV